METATEQVSKPAQAEARLVPIVEILVVPGDNVREEYDPESISGLAESLRNKGQLQSILIQPLDEPGPKGERYKLVAGYRRFLAAQEGGIECLFAIIREYEPELAAAANAAENLEREDVPLYAYIKRIKEFTDEGWDSDRIVFETGIRRDMCERLVEISTVAPEVLEHLKHDESLKTITRIQWCAKHIKGYGDDDRHKKQIEWWENKGWKAQEQKKKTVAVPRTAKPDQIIDVADRILAARLIEGPSGMVKLSDAQAEAVYHALMWCSSPKGRKPPL
jgi:ParB/RepB/Spo0J family partition protein